MGLSERGKMQSRCLGGAAVHSHMILQGFTSMPQVKTQKKAYFFKPLKKVHFKDKSYANINCICTTSLINTVVGIIIRFFSLLALFVYGNFS